jgi:diacylglycerol kinase family enzyme
MRVAIVTNPSSGRGRALVWAGRLATALARRGFVPVRLPIDAPAEDFAAGCTGAAVVVVVGGDGSVRSMAARLAGAPEPLAILPTGTENLAAREFGFFGCSVRRLVAAIEARRVRSVDLGVLIRAGQPDLPFLVMLSAGFDSDVVAAVSEVRRGPIARTSYLRPILALARGWVPPRVRAVQTGGFGEPADFHGQVVIANARQYAVRLDPARDADPADGMLDLAGLPMRGWVDCLRWAVRLWLARGRPAGLVPGLAPQWTLEFDRPVWLQVDGDLAPGGKTTVAEVAVRPGVLRLLDMRPG